MGSRTIQLAVFVVLGVGIGLLISRPWRSDPAAHVEDTPAVEPAPERAAPLPSAAVHPEPAPPTRTFKLPTMRLASAPPAAVVKEEVEEKHPPALVPKDWLVRGSGPQHYTVRSDKTEVMSGQASVLIAAHDRNVPQTAFASLMQSVVAEPWLGKRVEFTINVKGRGRFDPAEIWIRATDASGVVIAYNATGNFRGAAWTRNAVALDVPWSATELAYGVKVMAWGGLWVDGARLDALDKNANVNARNLPGQLGVVAQEASANGPLAHPSNMDFEDVGPATDAFKQAPPDQVGRNRF